MLRTSCTVDWTCFAGLGGTLVDLVTEPAAGLAERALSLVLGQQCRVADLVFHLLGGRPVSGRGRPECGVGHAVLPFSPAAAGHLAKSAPGCR
jgi:hypothetical protein